MSWGAGRGRRNFCSFRGAAHHAARRPVRVAQRHRLEHFVALAPRGSAARRWFANTCSGGLEPGLAPPGALRLDSCSTSPIARIAPPALWPPDPPGTRGPRPTTPSRPALTIDFGIVVEAMRACSLRGSRGARPCNRARWSSCSDAHRAGQRNHEIDRDGRGSSTWSSSSRSSRGCTSAGPGGFRRRTRIRGGAS